MLALVRFWTSQLKQQAGIVIEHLNDDENEWKHRYEFSPCRHSHTSQVWLQQQLHEFNLPPFQSVFLCMCKKTLSRACMYTPACAQTHPFASTVFLLMPNQRPWNLFTAVLLESPPIFQFQICFKWTWRTVCGYSRLVLLQKQWSSGPLIIFIFFNLLFYSVTGQQILINYGVLCLNVCHVGLL